MGKLTDEMKANLSEELIAKAMQCETPAELIELAKSEGIELTEDEAEAYLDEMDDVELDTQQLKAVTGGGVNWCWTACFECDKSCETESYPLRH